MRKLVSIRRVSEIIPIPDADFIERIKVDGWKLVSGKGNFKVGDPCVYFEIDSFLPVEPRFEFLRPGFFYEKSYVGTGFRIRTIKLRGQVSQGLALPLSDFPEVQGLPEGTDVTELLKVTKWELAPPISADAKGNFPSFFPTTDQERIQNCYDSFNEGSYEVSIKLDGSSCSFYYNNGETGVCSRNLELKPEVKSSFTNAFNKIKEVFSEYCVDTNSNLVIQGELMGPGIQGNREQLKETEFFAFDIFDIDKQKYLPPHQRRYILKKLDIKSVPILFEDLSITRKTHSLDFLLEMAEGTSYNKDVTREGLVFKHTTGQTLFDDPIKSFKVISNKYLLKEK